MDQSTRDELLEEYEEQYEEIREDYKDSIKVRNVLQRSYYAQYCLPLA